MARIPGAIGWSRPDYDLDDLDAGRRLVERDRPEVVIHAAAWTDVDGCARQPELARVRNADAVMQLALACAAGGVQLLVVSTNEVFNGERTDGLGYVEGDATDPLNPYGASKTQGEQAARAAMDAKRLWIVRTAWLYGPPGNDFPSKIIAASDRLAPDEPLRVVDDEWGSPTYAPDLADAIWALLQKQQSEGGLFHLVNPGSVTRREWASRVLARCRPERRIIPISRNEFRRASRVPAWGVLNSDRAWERVGVRLRTWDEALSDYLPLIC
jgi:dTDP-4-dehydrorhamnose reductase